MQQSDAVTRIGFSSKINEKYISFHLTAPTSSYVSRYRPRRSIESDLTQKKAGARARAKDKRHAMRPKSRARIIYNKSEVLARVSKRENEL